MIILQLESKDVRLLLRWLEQPTVRYEWHQDDAFHVSQIDGSARMYVRLMRFAPDSEDLAEGLKLLRCTLVEEDWFALTGGSGLTRSEFLRQISIVPAATPHGRRTVLVALFGDVTEAMKELYARAPKTPSQRTRVVFLQESEDRGCPTAYFEIPQADPTFDWRVFAEAARRRWPACGARAYYELTSSTEGVDILVEVGMEHPLQEIGRYYPNEEAARKILIGHIDGKTVWTRLRPEDQRAEYEFENGRADAFEIAVERQVEQAMHHVAVDADVPVVRMPLELMPLASERLSQLDNLEARIQAAKESLFRMEAERKSLLERKRDRCHFLLRFEQDLSQAPEERRIARNFERFLLLSKRRLQSLTYVFQQVDSNLGYHVVSTTEPAFAEELHLALAEQVYYQPAYWEGWELDVYVREGLELLPRIDQQELARLLDEALGKVIAGDRRGSQVLIDRAAGQPAAGKGEASGAIGVTVVSRGRSTNLGGSLEFLNTQFSTVVPRSIGRAKKELRESLEKQKQDLVSEIETAEKELVQEADRRLKTAHDLWESVSPQVEEILQRSRLVDEHFAEVEEILTEFRTGWKRIAELLLDTNERLLASKTEALAELARWHPEWAEGMADLARRDVDVQALLVELRPQLDEVVARAMAALKSAEESYAGVKQLYDVVAGTIQSERERLQLLTEEAGSKGVEISAANAELERQMGAANQVLEAVEEELARLTRQGGGFATTITRIEAQCDATDRALEKLTAQEEKVRRVRDEWAIQNAAAEDKSVEVLNAREVAVGTIQDIKGRCEGLVARAEEVDRELREREDEVRRRMNELHTKLTRSERQRAALGKLEGELAGLQDKLTAERESISELQPVVVDALDTTRPLIEDVEDACQDRLEEMRQRMTRLVEDLDVLAQAELSLGLLDDRRGQIGRLASLVVEADFRPLESDEYKAIWGSSGQPQANR